MDLIQLRHVVQNLFQVGRQRIISLAKFIDICLIEITRLVASHGDLIDVVGRDQQKRKQFLERRLVQIDNISVAGHFAEERAFILSAEQFHPLFDYIRFLFGNLSYIPTLLSFAIRFLQSRVRR